MITENGAVEGSVPLHDGRVRDVRRTRYLRGHVAAIEQAIAEGADVRGYLHWSLLDNFEWSLGYRPRFGLVHVDYRTGERIPKDSALHYAQIVAANGLVPWTDEAAVG
jgi:beta-glucosidase